MNFTVADLLAMPQMEHAVLAAGANGVHSAIRDMAFIELPPSISQAAFLTPDKRKNQEKGCILLSSFYAVSESVEEQLRAIRSFAKEQCSALILFHVGYILKTVDQQVLDLCNQLDLPLIIAPPTMLYSEVNRLVLNRLSAVQMKRLEYAQSIYNRMTTLLLEEKTPEHIVQALNETISKKVLFYNYAGTCVHSGEAPSEELDKYIRRNITYKRSVFLSSDKYLTVPALSIGNQLIFVPVVSSAFFHGVLVICDIDHLPEWEHIAVSQAKNALAISSYNKIKKTEYNDLVLRDFLSDITTRDSIDEESALQRGRALGVDLTKIGYLAVVDIYNFEKISQTHTEAELQDVKSMLKHIVDNQIAAFSDPSFPDITVSFSDKILILFMNACKDKELAPRVSMMCHNIIRQCIELKQFEAYIGAGDVCRSVAGIKSCYDRAFSALRVVRNFIGPSNFAFYDNVALLSEFFKCAGMKPVQHACLNILQPLIEYDEKNSGDLLNTLGAILHANLSLSTASERIFVHKNTISQRRKKIIDLLGHDPFSLPFRLQYEMAYLFYTNEKIRRK